MKCPLLRLISIIDFRFIKYKSNPMKEKINK